MSIREIDIHRLGILDRGIRDIVLKEEKETTRERLIYECVRRVAVQAFHDNIVRNEESLAVREINPECDLTSPFPIDLLAGNRSTIYNIDNINLRCPAEWRSPVWGFYQKANDWITLYNDRMDRNRSCMIIYGSHNLSQDLYCSRLRFKRDHVKIMQIEDLANLAVGDDLLTETPVMYRAGDRPVIEVKTNSNAIHQCDHIKLLGFVAEALGSVIAA